MSATHCLNCNTPLNGAYCHACGQKGSTHRLSFGHFIIHDAVHGLWHVDGSFFFTIGQAIRRPGKAALEYIAGKRRKYFNLVTLLLLLAGINVFVRGKLEPVQKQTSFVEFSTGDDTSAVKVTKSDAGLPQAGLTYDTSESDSAPSAAPAGSRPQRVGHLVQDWMANNQKWILLGFIPLISLANRVVFRRTKYNYAENIIVAAFFLSGLLVLGLFAMLLSAAVTALIPGRITFAPLISLVFMVFAYWQTFRHQYKTVAGWAWRFLAAFLFFAIVFMLVAIAGFAIVALATEGPDVFTK